MTPAGGEPCPTDAGLEEARPTPSEADKVHQEMSAACDLAPAQCRFKYLVCSTPRTGSTLLCTGLASSGSAGLPLEYYSGTHVQAYLHRIGSSKKALKLAEYWQFLLRHRTSPNGVFGMKMHFADLAHAFKTKQAQRSFLGEFDHFILLTRRNKLAQAVSFAKARETGTYRVGADESDAAPPPEAYNFRYLAKTLGWISDREAQWRVLLADLRDKTTAITYEELAADYAASLARILTALGLTDSIPALDPRPRIVPQRDETSRQWEDRFMQDLRSGESHL